MLQELLARIQQGNRTIKYPKGKVSLSDRYRGLPVFNHELCEDGCRACVDSCPAGALDKDRTLLMDLGRCLFCTECTNACSAGAISFSTDHRLAVREREDLLLRHPDTIDRARALEGKMRRLFGRSLKLRQVSAGGCAGCEVDLNVLSTVVYDMGRFGIQFVASPRHADGIVVTGPVTDNMKLALEKTYEALPDPRIVIACGSCAISGGPFRDHSQVHNGIGDLLPVDLFIPGCPPHPLTTLDGLLRLMGKIEGKKKR